MTQSSLQSTENSIAPVEEIRRHFPALERIHNGRPVAYFDGPGGTQVPRQVVETMTDYLYNHNANTHWAYPTSNETDEIIAYSRDAFADFLNASPDEIVFGQNMTTLTFHLSRALGRQFGPGDEIIVTELDHHANVDTWRALEKDRGIAIQVLPMSAGTGQLVIDKLPDLLNARTRLVAIGAASNALGTINEIKQVVSLSREAGALTFVDAVHYAAHNLTDVKAIGCDFLACSAYKFYGPHIGILYGRAELLESIDFPKLRPAPNYAPDRAETGTLNHESIAGAAAAVDFLASFALGGSRRERLAAVFAEMHSRQQQMVTRLWTGLSAIEGVTVYGPPPEQPRTSTISFSMSGTRPDEVTSKLADRAVFTSNGNFYALTAIEKLNPEGMIRAGCAIYTTNEDVERLLEGVQSLAK